jgi:hypothetical protein
MNSITNLFGSIIRSITSPQPQPKAIKKPLQAAILPAGGGAIRGGTTLSTTSGGGGGTGGIF